MAEVTRASRMAIVKETTEGVLKVPASGSDFLALQEGFETDIGQESIDNPELKASIGQSAPQPGIENPTASVSHVLRHSGTEGVAPQAGYQNLLEGAFGSVTVNATEYDTVGGSTVSAINVDTGEGAFFSVGEGLLVKHASFPWEIAVVKSVSGDVITPLFNLQNAPASGTNLGKAVHYSATDSGHPSLSIHDYRGNGQAYVAEAGMKVESMSVSANAGEILNADYSLAGSSGYYDPITLAATDIYLDFTDDAGTFAAVLEAKTYRSPIALATAIQTAMDAVTTTTPTVTYSNTTGKFTIKTTGTLLSLLWNTGTNAANTIGDKIGFSTAADDTGTAATTGYTSDNAISLASPYTPSFDSPGTPLVVKNNDLYIGSASDNVCVKASDLSFEIANDQTNKDSLCAESGRDSTIITGRTVTMTVTTAVPQYKANWFEAMRDGTGVSAQFNFGSKSGDNYMAGKSGCFSMKDAVITVHNLGDSDGLVVLNLELTAYVDSSANPEVALNLL